MLDGTKLASNVWLPDSDGPLPVLLTRTPYGKDHMATYNLCVPNIFELMKNGYAVVVQECRGTFGSGGTFVPHVADADDGAETVRWLIEQEWCDGNVGSFGGSYLGLVQWHTASTGVPGFKAMSPAVTSADLYGAPWHSPGGALSLGMILWWATLMSINEAQRALESGIDHADISGDLEQLLENVANQEAVAAVTPVSEHPLIAKYLPWAIDVAIGHPDYDQTWVELSALERVSSITTSALHIGGWYDLLYGETLRAFTEMKARAGSAEAREGQRLIMGPWSHGPNGHFGFFPDRQFGPAASMEAAKLSDYQIEFFDRSLKGREDALKNAPSVRIFVMGIDQWRDESDWPLPDTTYTAYYLTGDGSANTAGGAGGLSTSEPAGDKVDSYLYDPRCPVPSLGGTLLKLDGYDGPADQRSVHSREDVLCFTTDVLDHSVEVTGPISATLHVSSSATDTDFTAKLVDIHPDGRAIILCDGIQRMRYRNSLSIPKLMTPGDIYEITIDLIATSNVFLPGHRIMLEISSSNFPRYDRNSNTGGIIADECEADMIPALNRIHRGAKHPSRITLPIINRPLP
jgi:hypothetical protein